MTLRTVILRYDTIGRFLHSLLPSKLTANYILKAIIFLFRYLFLVYLTFETIQSCTFTVMLAWFALEMLLSILASISGQTFYAHSKVLQRIADYKKLTILHSLSNECIAFYAFSMLLASIFLLTTQCVVCLKLYGMPAPLYYFNIFFLMCNVCIANLILGKTAVPYNLSSSILHELKQKRRIKLMKDMRYFDRLAEALRPLKIVAGFGDHALISFTESTRVNYFDTIVNNVVNLLLITN